MLLKGVEKKWKPRNWATDLVGGVPVFRAVLAKRQDTIQTLLVNSYPHFGGVPCLHNQGVSIIWYLILKKDNESLTENKNVGPKGIN
jgi:hypothetical protein